MRHSIADDAVSIARDFGGALVDALQARLALAALELRREKIRTVQTIFWVSAIVFLAMMSLAFISLVVVYLFWESARLEALGGLASLYGLALLATIVAFRRFLARQPKAFAATLRVLEADRDAIAGKD